MLSGVYPFPQMASVVFGKSFSGRVTRHSREVFYSTPPATEDRRTDPVRVVDDEIQIRLD
jgi:hypothetical protein